MPGTGIRTIVRRRANGLCEICGDPIPRNADGRPDHSFHHRFMRRMEGIDSVANLLYTCIFCHRAIHRDEQNSSAFGWISYVDPEVTPVLIRKQFWAVLPYEGFYERVAPDDADALMDWLKDHEDRVADPFARD